MKVSFSSIQTFLACQARYAFKYRDGLRAAAGAAHFEPGSIVHAAFVPILTAHWQGERLPSAEDAVRDGCKALREKRGMTLDSEEHAALAVRSLTYHVPRMRLESWETLTHEDKPAVELELAVPFGGATLQAHIDWVARSRVTGKVYIIDHKTSKHRMGEQAWVEHDLQLALYREACRIEGIDVQESLLHQMCNFPPAEPTPLKRPGKGGRRFSCAKNLRTTWEQYENALITHGEDPAQYQDMRDLLDDQCARSPFRRWARNITTAAGHAAMIEVALGAIKEMRRIKYDDDAPAVPSRVSEWTCGARQCDHRSWCDALMLGLDPRSLLRTVYTADEGSPYADQETDDLAALRLHTKRLSATGRYDLHGWSPHKA